MEGMFREIGIYGMRAIVRGSTRIKLPITRKHAMARFGKGITEAGSMSSFNAAGTAYSSHGINMIPFLYLLLDVRIPTHWDHLGRRRYASQGLLDRWNARSDHLEW